MPKNLTKPKATFKELEKEITPVFVMNNDALRPYAELFEYSPENLYQKPLGSLIGFFEIKEYSNDSAYIVNALTSVLKKEYYSNPKKSVSESLDSALHKVNISLSNEVAKGNINWLGHLDGVICIIEKNSIHFSVTGKGQIFIKRGNQITNISEGLAPDNTNPHPLKTFIDVSSGHIESDDKLFIFSDDIFQILSPAELKKSLLRFDQEKFNQFIKTALSNELELTSAIVVDVKNADEKKSSVVAFAESNELAEETNLEDFNAFSEKTYSKKNKINKLSLPIEEKSEKLENKNYTDKKTGHIYVQGEENNIQSASQAAVVASAVKEKISDLTLQAKNEMRKKIILLRKKIVKFQEKRKIENAKKREQLLELQEKIKLEDLLDDQKQITENITIQQEAEIKDQAILAEDETLNNLEDNTELQEKNLDLTSLEEKNSISLKEKIKLAKNELQKENNFPENNASPEKNYATSLQEKINQAREEMTARFDNAMKTRERKSKETEAENMHTAKKTKDASFLLLIRKVSEKIFPAISAAKNFYKTNLSVKQKILAFLAIFLIFIVFPFILLKKNNTPEVKPQTENSVPAITAEKLLLEEKNMIVSPEIQTTSLEAEIISILTYQNNPLAITKQKIIENFGGKNNEYQIPSEYGQAKNATFMKDLNLVLILTDQKKIVSFSPISKQFKDNNINLADISDPKLMATYLTYLYIPDASSGQIYRYPRVEGGFGEKTNWLKDTQQLKEISGLTIDDSVYLTTGDAILKFFKGEKQNTSFENSQTPISFDNIYTSTESSFIYILDKKNTRLIQYNKNGEIIRQHFLGKNLQNITAFTVDSHDEKAYLVSEKNLLTVSL